MTMRPGTLITSLDFELFWGVRDSKSIAQYGANILGVRKAIPRMLDLFVKHELHATWATVGFLFFDGKDELLASLPAVLPEYTNRRLSPYLALETLGRDEAADPHHFAPSLVRKLAETPYQEVGTHTFSHYYCLERGQDGRAFRADLEAAQSVASRKFGLALKSLVFPRNQFNADYLQIAAEMGIEAYRGNERSWIYSAKNGEQETTLRRGCRLTDAYLPLTGENTYRAEDAKRARPSNLPSSRFLRPFSARLAPLDRLRLRRILAGLTHAAETGTVFHLWWHPHNFGQNLDENMEFLTTIVEHAARLRDSHGFESKTMGEVAAGLLQ